MAIYEHTVEPLQVRVLARVDRQEVIEGPSLNVLGES